MCHPGFQKQALQNFFFGLKLGSPEQIFAKNCVSGAKNQQKLVLKCEIFKKMQVGSLEREKCLKRWVSGAKIWSEKGDLEVPYHFPM